MTDEMREQLAALIHQQWCAYMAYHLAQCERADGSFAIPYEYHRALKRLINTPYAELTDGEKESDREEADKVLAVIGNKGGLTWKV
jgi:hypothetical protein